MSRWRRHARRTSRVVALDSKSVSALRGNSSAAARNAASSWGNCHGAFIFFSHTAVRTAPVATGDPFPEVRAGNRHRQIRIIFIPQRVQPAFVRLMTGLTPKRFSLCEAGIGPFSTFKNRGAPRLLAAGQPPGRKGLVRRAEFMLADVVCRDGKPFGQTLMHRNVV